MTWRNVIGLVALCLILLVPACKKAEEEKPKLEVDPRTACLNGCKTESENMFKQCRDELFAQGLFDRQAECNTKADDYSKTCRAECDEKHPVGQAG